MALRFFRRRNTKTELETPQESEVDRLYKRIKLVGELLSMIPVDKKRDHVVELASLKNASLSSSVEREKARGAIDRALMFVYARSRELLTLIDFVVGSGKDVNIAQLIESISEQWRKKDEQEKYSQGLALLSVFEKLVELFGSESEVIRQTELVRKKYRNQSSRVESLNFVGTLGGQSIRSLVPVSRGAESGVVGGMPDADRFFEADYEVLSEVELPPESVGPEAMRLHRVLLDELEQTRKNARELLMDIVIGLRLWKELGVKRLDSIAHVLGLSVQGAGNLLLKLAEGEIVFTDFIKRKSPELFLKIKTNPKLKWALEFARSGYEKAIVTVRRRWLLITLSILVATQYMGDGVKRNALETLLIPRQKSEQPGKAKEPGMRVNPEKTSSPQVVEKPAAPDSSVQVDVANEEIVVPDAPPVPTVSMSDLKEGFDTSVSDEEVTTFFKNRFAKDTNGVLFQKLVIYLLTLNKSDQEAQIQNWKSGGYPDPSETNTLFQDAITNRPGGLKPYVGKTPQTGGAVSPNEAFNGQISIFLQNYPTLHPGNRK